MNGGEITAGFLRAHGIDTIFTLIGGHISPILVESKKKGIRVIDVRHEVNAVFAADAWARLKGIPGAAVVTAGPGVTNTVTAVRNALMAQTPLLLLGGATATALRGRGSLQDIDQMALMRSNVKKTYRVSRIRQLLPTLQRAWQKAQQGVPGPVFIELPVDLLYDEKIVREWYAESSPQGGSLAARMVRGYLLWHVNRLFAGAHKHLKFIRRPVQADKATGSSLEKLARRIRQAKRPLVIAGSQVVFQVEKIKEIASALESLGAPVYLSGMARGLLGNESRIQFRHKRKEALREADLIILLGVPADFRLNYGAHLNRRAFHVNINLDRRDLRLNKRPDLAIQADAGLVLLQLAEMNASVDVPMTEHWRQTLKEREAAREKEIVLQAAEKMKLINPVDFFLKTAVSLPKKTILVADGGDFVATGSYILRPEGPLTWLDPGVFGTLGVGAGFALGAKLARPDYNVIILYGDGSAGYSLMEFDTFVRHKIAAGAIIGNDACWTQIYRDQITFLKDDVACMLDYSPYEQIARAFKGAGTSISKASQITPGLKALGSSLKAGKPFVLNVMIGRSEFRKGSISM